MNAIRARVGALQDAVRAKEMETYGRSGNLYGDGEVMTAIVHCREDIVLLVGYLGELNRQVETIRRLAWVAVVCLALLVYRIL